LNLALGYRGSPIDTIGLPRSRAVSLAIATATVLGVHAALLLFRLDASGLHQASRESAMAVRFIPSSVIEMPASYVRDADQPPVVRREPEPAASAKSGDAGPKELPTRVKPAERGTTPAASRREFPLRVEPVPTPQVAVRPPAESALAPAPDYLLGARLDPGPRPLGSIEPEYPDSANLQEGKVVLRVLISDTGVVDDVAVVRAEPKGLFESAALDAFRVARFSPGMVLGSPVKSQITVEVEFLPINRGARISGRMY
jgi:TonB family protein